MQFENITIRFSILNIQIERRTAEDFWESYYLIYDHTKSAIVFNEVLENDTAEFNGNLKTILNGIKTFLNTYTQDDQVTPETNILYHDIQNISGVLTNETWEPLNRNETYIGFTDHLGLDRSIRIEKCIVQLSDLQNEETLDVAFTENRIYQNLVLSDATNVGTFGLLYVAFIQFLQTY
jgi:hypothetical protein